MLNSDWSVLKNKRRLGHDREVIGVDRAIRLDFFPSSPWGCPVDRWPCDGGLRSTMAWFYAHFLGSAGSCQLSGRNL